MSGRNEKDINTSDPGGQYSKLVGFVYIFNLIVGTGALTMPAAFKEAGWILSLVAVVVLAFMSYMTLTFMIEAMAISNAKLRFQEFVTKGSLRKDSLDSSLNTGERQPLLNSEERRSPLMYKPRASYSEIHPSFEITERVEMGTMAAMYFNRVGLLFFHLCIIIYLYGDLAIYAAAVPKTIRDIACTYKNSSSVNSTDINTNKSLSDKDPCWPTNSLNRMDAYRIFVTVFVLLLGPFTFFNVQKTKYLQFLTSLARWLAFLLMIILTSIRLGKGEGLGKPEVANVSGVPNLFGVCVYSFMCHHSLPSLVTPIKNKSRLLQLVAGDYLLILLFYLLLSFTAVFAIDKIEDLYSLNFKPGTANALTDIVPIQYFLALFPVFTLSTSFPIIAITLRNNLNAMLTSQFRTLPWYVPRLVCPLLAIIPPFIVAISTNQVEFLVGITGSYAGAGIQYIIPAVLVLLARKEIIAIGGGYIHRSPLSHKGWVILTLVWACICVAFVTSNYIIKN
ncbi:transmembrane protein 104-like [Physella acuta]|uniref:transmembrane protein 104-like n=1 Tax=Physella acuta TaxID=109671 RepID=UPI0027DDAF84|nr:transmembrane protein 104-like [Physella acuta]XP_059163853.1 transmembrane protein 104-like [Physella acuta]XP_059163855.1 transmembrane protein 104-like [Physella acuta]XP_059163856.1 transmembrane protein 104-like [Physella acuta]